LPLQFTALALAQFHHALFRHDTTYLSVTDGMRRLAHLVSG
jgi:hypothetical protein